MQHSTSSTLADLRRVRDKLRRELDPYEAVIRATDTLARRRMVVESVGAWLERRAWMAADPDLAPELDADFQFVRRLISGNFGDRAFGKLTYARAVALIKPKRGPQNGGLVGFVARLSAAVGAFGDADATTAKRKFKDALRETKRSSRKR